MKDIPLSILFSSIVATSTFQRCQWPRRNHYFDWKKNDFANSAGCNAAQATANNRQLHSSSLCSTILMRHYHSSVHSSQLLSNTRDEIDDPKLILQKYGFGNRLVALTNSDLAAFPKPAELYDSGSWKLCLIVGMKLPSSMPSSLTSSSASKLIEMDKPPLVEVLIIDGTECLGEAVIVDVGQITTIWDDFPEEDQSSANKLQSALSKSKTYLQNNILSPERAMQALYNSRIGLRTRRSSGKRRDSLTKNQIPKIASQFSNPQRIEELLRNLLKVGEDRISRIVDSTLAMDYLFSDFCSRGEDGRAELIMRKILSADVLAKDAISGGRFKRRSCQFVSGKYAIDHLGECNAERGKFEVTFVNGGWISVDPSVKAGTEGRKFAVLGDESLKNAKIIKSSNDNGKESATNRIFTAADERIAHRLECLAMGDIWREDLAGDDSRNLEMDVRQALSSMNLPLSPEGAASALVRIGKWSEKSNASNQGKAGNSIEPWSLEVLEASRSLARFESERRALLSKNCASAKIEAASKEKIKSSESLEGRTDLSQLPCVCVDAQRATFRDDSIGIRLRSSTGRKVMKQASKWEILIHIADVSDIYFGKDYTGNSLTTLQNINRHFDLLRQASEQRGQSRYDLPIGPLHLFPPVALSALSFVVNEKDAVNRCVTVWAYIDERDGKLLDAGLERTIISSPCALSFSDATKVVECEKDDVPKSLSNTKAILSVAERNLSLWSKHQLQKSEAARKREMRLAARELISNEIHCESGASMRDDGVSFSFQRSRGHRIVDSSLDLYSFALRSLMKRAKQPLPFAAGTGIDRNGRIATAPLRRYIDGIAQRQAISVLCNYDRPLSLKDCKTAAKIASKASDNISNLKSSKVANSFMPKNFVTSRRRQVSALHNLARHLESTGGIGNRRQVKAISTGRNNEVVIEGTGAVARCRGVEGTLGSGDKIRVQVDQIEPEKGLLVVTLV